MAGRRDRFAVIGGGLSGMTAALVLARYDREVTLIEEKTALGQTLRGFSRQGVHFDTGLHYAGGLDPDGVLSRYFRFLGLEELPLADFNQDCFDRIRFTDTGREILLPVGYEATLDALCTAFPAESRFIRVYLADLHKAFFSSAFLNFGGDWRALMDEALHAESLATVLAAGTNDAALRAVLSIHSLLYGVSPDETPFAQHARIAGSYLDGVKTIVGGGKTLVAALEARLALAGVTVRRGQAARQFRVGPDRAVTAVLLENGEDIPVDGAVFTGHPALLPPMLPPGAVKPAFVGRLLALEDTMSAFSLFCVSDAPVPSLHGSNLFLCTTEGVTPGFRPDCVPEAGPFYLSGSPVTEMGGPRGSIVFAPGSAAACAAWGDSWSGRRPEGYTRFKKKTLAAVWRSVTTHCPELTGARVVAGGTPLTNRDFLTSPGCGLYGTKHSLHQFSPLPATRIPNLWMAGQSVIAPGVLGAVISGVVACGFVLGLDAIRKEVAACG